MAYVSMPSTPGSPANTYSAFSGKRWQHRTRSFSRNPHGLCYLRIVRSCRSSLFWRCQKPPESGLLAEAAFPALPKIHSYLVTGERDPGTDSSTLDGYCPKTQLLPHRSSPSYPLPHLRAQHSCPHLLEGFRSEDWLGW